MRELEKTKDMLRSYLRKVAIIAKIGIESGEWTREESEKFVIEYGNEQFAKILNMGAGEFAVFALTDALSSINDVKEVM